MKFLPVILLIGIIANVCCVLIFRLKLDRHYQSEFTQLSNTLKSDIANFAAESLRSIDYYFVSNCLNQSTFAITNNNNYATNDDVFYKDGGEWFYTYFRNDDLDYARVGIVDFSVGSPFPRGGTITAIYPDMVVVDDRFSVRNKHTLDFLSSSLSSNNESIPQIEKIKPEYKSNKELAQYVRTTHTSNK